MPRKRKILIACLLIILISYNPGAIYRPDRIVDKLVPANIRLTNSLSDSPGFSSINKIVSSFMRRWSIHGASMAIAKEGKLVYARGFGIIDTISGEETQPYHKFRIASVSKLITAVAVMKLTEEGKLSLDEKVFGPDGILNDPFYNNPKDKRVYDITVLQLLSHEGGWSQTWGDQMFMPLVVADKMGLKPPVDTRTIVRFALDKNLQYTPGTGKSYSNLGYSVLGLVIEKVTGMSYEKYCRQYVLEPLGIFDMSLARNLSSDRAPFEVSYYEPSDVVLKPSIYGTGEMVEPSYGGNDIEALGAAGAWIATAPDLIRLMFAIDGFSRPKDILSESSVNFMTDNSNSFAPIGWKGTREDGTWWRTGSFPGSAAMVMREADGTEWVVLLNSSAWNGPEIYSYINGMMIRILGQVKQWPQTDLLDYSLAVPLRSGLRDTSDTK